MKKNRIKKIINILTQHAGTHWQLLKTRELILAPHFAGAGVFPHIWWQRAQDTSRGGNTGKPRW